MASSDLSTKCGICLCHFIEPKILPCFHTFCLKCLENNVQITENKGLFPCPVCRTSITIPDGGVKCFQRNFYIQTTGSDENGSDCDVCDMKVPAEWKCKKCEQNFCKSCAEIQERESLSCEHNLVSIPHENGRKRVLTCMEHPSEEITIICKECDKFICNICKDILHNTHSSSLLSAEAGLKRKELKDLLETVKKQVDEYERDINIVKSQAISKHKNFDEQTIDLRNQKDNIILSIIKKFEGIENEIKRINAEQWQFSNDICENKRSKITTVKESIEEAKTFCDQEQNHILINRFGSVIEKIRGMEVTIAEQTPNVPGHDLMDAVEQCTVWFLKLNEIISGK